MIWYFYTLWNNHKTSYYPLPYKVVKILSTIFPMCTLHPCDLFYIWKCTPVNPLWQFSLSFCSFLNKIFFLINEFWEFIVQGICPLLDVCSADMFSHSLACLNNTLSREIFTCDDVQHIRFFFFFLLWFMPLVSCLEISTQPKVTEIFFFFF